MTVVLRGPGGPARAARPALAAACLAALLALLCLVPASARDGASPAIAGSPDNSADERKVLLREILPDLRVFVDLREGQMPHNRMEGVLSAAEVKEAIGLGIGNWASVLPALRFRLVETAAEANLVIRFREYGPHIPGGSSAVAFLPGAWQAGPWDFSCGEKEIGKLPDGSPCDETSHNIILFQSKDVAFRKVHFSDFSLHQEYLEAKADRKDPRKRYFRMLPDKRFNVWPADRSTCIPGAAVRGVLPAWDVQCLTEGDWAALPRYDVFGLVGGPNDIASMVQHEVGHTLFGGHTGESAACQTVVNADFMDERRDPVFTRRPVRLLEWKDADGRKRASYSVLFPGNAIDAALNVRGIFEADAMRLASPASDYACKPYGTWKGFETLYPASNAWIVLRKPTGETKYVDDWRYAQRLMGWPEAGGAPAPAEWFQVGLLPKASSPGP